MRSRRGFTMIEILVSVAILAIMFGLMFRPLLMAIEVLSLGRGEERVQSQSRGLVNQLNTDLQAALKVYPNLAAYDLDTGTGTGAGALYRTPQPSRLDLVPPARDSGGRLIVPVRPAYVNNDPQRPLVITYWVMREDPTREYNPETNPQMVYRAAHSYQVPPKVDPTDNYEPQPPASPDELWRYSVQLARYNNESLVEVGPRLARLFFPASVGSFDWLVANLERPVPTATEPIMRGPTSDLTYSNAPDIVSVSPVTDRETDVRGLTFLPLRSDLEELQVNDDCSAYRGRRGRWVQPYQRTTDGQYTLPSNGLIERSNSGGALPIVALFRPPGTRDGGGPLGEEYFVSIIQDPTSAAVGHPYLFRVQADNTADPVPVYDLTDYPKRTFQRPPGTWPDSTNPGMSGEMACGIDYDTGEIVTSFEQKDVIYPSVPGSTLSQIHALSNYSLVTGITGNPDLTSNDSSPANEWQALPLTWINGSGTPNGAATLNGSMLDDFVLDTAGSGPGVYDSYVLSVFRPQRLRTDTSVYATDDLFSGAEISSGGAYENTTARALEAVRRRRLNMSVVPGSVRVVVSQYALTASQAASPTGVLGTAPLLRRTYTPVREQVPGAVDAGSLQPFQYNVDPASGRLTFYDPQLAVGGLTSRDGLNPPCVVQPDPNVDRYLVPVIFVSYRYRNNLPTAEDQATGNDANGDVVVATYRSLEAIDVKLVLDVPTESTRGETETINDPLAAQPVERPTGARRRVEVSTVLQVGTRH